jgi:hypothetical protein
VTEDFEPLTIATPLLKDKSMQALHCKKTPDQHFGLHYAYFNPFLNLTCHFLLPILHQIIKGEKIIQYSDKLSQQSYP